MRYYIMYPESSQDDLIREDHQLGEDNGFGVFWASKGFNILEKAVNEGHDILNHISIYNDQGKSITVETFLDNIAKLKVRINNG